MWDEYREYEMHYDVDMGYLEDDIEEFGEYNDDYSSVWHNEST